ncbi:PREDICTED: binding partner of ACD11 1 isoform X2 [Camelina sativa]|uniref:Binding partner of ACD11 1 isoform X1 n=1 Tax=Camelina sativa TaxID=90675 RepID=A0ABM0UEF7_CAMSA|nr:PREDICTED: binding partner of ACD11 1 isoform X1 [Camelina sativa]XP_010439954.1 PREDICTED: binding partner of ACD11 1 isoform X2 [Camelina sativa]
MSMTSVKVSNVSLGATDRDLKEFFSFSGDILYLEMQSETERTKLAYVTFKDLQGAETAVLLSGATIVDSSVIVTMAPDYHLSPEALASLEPKDSNKSPRAGDSVLRKAEDVVSSMLAKGFILGKDAIAKAKSVDEKHQLTSTASAKVASFDKKIGFTDKINTGTVVVGEKVREVDQKYQVSEKTKSAIAAAEQTVSNAGSAIMKNRYVLTGATWVTGAYNRVAKVAEEVGQKAKEKAGMAEEEDKRKVVDEFARVHLSESPKAASSTQEAEHESKPSEFSEAKKESEHLEPQPQPPQQQSPPSTAPVTAPAPTPAQP